MLRGKKKFLSQYRIVSEEIRQEMVKSVLFMRKQEA